MNKKLLYLCVLLMVSVIARIFYAGIYPAPIINADSYGYYGIAREILEKPELSTFVNQYRTPVYPTMLALLAAANGYDDTSLDDPSFKPVLNQLVLIQSLAAVLCVGFVYLLLIKLSLPVFWAFIFSLLFSLNMYLYPLEHAVMTDSLANSLLVVLTFLAIHLIQKPSKGAYIVFGVVSAVSWLLRPNLLLIPCVTLPLFWFISSHRRYLQTNIIILLFSILLPVIFVLLNSQYHGYQGISQASEIALLGRILEFRLPLDAGKQYKTYYESVHEYWQLQDGELSPFEYIDLYTPLTYVDTALMMELRSFDRAVILANLPEYIFKSISYIPYIFSDSAPLLGFDENASGGLAGFYSLVWSTNKITWYAGYFVFLFLPLAVSVYIRKPSSMHLIPVLLGVIGVSQLLVIVLLDYYERGLYARLASAVQLQVYLFLIVIAYQYYFRKRI